jgi:hypothetical protein
MPRSFLLGRFFLKCKGPNLLLLFLLMGTTTTTNFLIFADMLLYLRQYKSHLKVARHQKDVLKFYQKHHNKI